MLPDPSVGEKVYDEPGKAENQEYIRNEPDQGIERDDNAERKENQERIQQQYAQIGDKPDNCKYQGIFVQLFQCKLECDHERIDIDIHGCKYDQHQDHDSLACQADQARHLAGIVQYPVCPYGYQRQESDDKIDSADDHALPEVRYCRILEIAPYKSMFFPRIVPQDICESCLYRPSGYHRDAHYHGQQDKLHYHVIEQFLRAFHRIRNDILKEHQHDEHSRQKSRKVKNQVHHVDFYKIPELPLQNLEKYYERRFGRRILRYARARFCIIEQSEKACHLFILASYSFAWS